MKVATLVYVRRAGHTLMVHRVKKAQDMHAGKWNGLGGKLEPGEAPEACAAREVLEESGLTLHALRWRGLLTFPAFAQGEDWLAFVYTADQFDGALIDSPEGNLAWIPDGALTDLPLWEGDRIFLPWLDQAGFFSGRFAYVDGTLAEWSATFYGPDGGELRREAGSEGSAAEVGVEAAAPQTGRYRYTPAEDTYCWLCGGAVEKVHCKITCLTCGFRRDCSDP